MTEEVLNRPCVRITLCIDGKDVSLGSGTLVRGKEGFYVITAHHCIYGNNNIYPDIQIHQIVIESQFSFNSPFYPIEAIEIVTSNQEDDWAVIKVKYEDIDGLHPEICATVNFQRDNNVVFTGFQAVNKNESRSFKCKIQNAISGNEFRITLAEQETFKAGSDHAIGLSGSGAFLVSDTRILLIGILKSVKGDDALNNDIKCCCMSEIGALIGLEFCESETGTSGDHWGSEQFGQLVIKDKRSLMEKIIAVNSSYSSLKMQRLVRNLALGKSEMSGILPRDLSAIKFRLFDPCQEELENFVEDHKDSFLTPEQIENLIAKFTQRGMAIIKVKSKMYQYPILDEDLMRKIVLDLINECYLSFDKEGLYATE
jgi:hypothetical protein